MKNNRIKSLILSLAMIVSFLPGSFVLTKASSVTNPGVEVWHDWDFENGVAPEGWINTGSDARVTMTHPKYGKGMALSSGKQAKETFTPAEVINSGVVNISFDFIGDAERGNEHLSFNYVGVEEDRRYVFFMTGADKFMMGKDNLAQWGDSSKSKAFEFDKLYHVDMLFDFDNLVFTSYINGELIGTSKLSSANDIKNTFWYFEDSYFFDNLRMARIEKNSYEIQKTYWVGDYLEVLLSEGAGKDEHSLGVSDFTVTESKTGEIVIPSEVEVIGRRVIFSGLEKGKEYDITFPEDFKNFMGIKLDTGSGVWHDWNFENGVAPAGWVNTDSDPRVTVTHEKYGKAMAFQSGKTGRETFTPQEPIKTGVVNISFDFMGDAERGNEHLSFNYVGVEEDRRYVFFMTGADKFMMGKDNLAQWGDSSKSKAFELDKLYHVDLLFDFDNLLFTSYVNGELIGTSKLSSANEIKNTYWYFENAYFFDNYRMAKIEDNSYKIQKMYWVGEYLEILLSEGAGKDEHSLTVSDFTVTDSKTGAKVTPSDVEVVGRRVIFSGLDKEKDYKIAFPETFKNFMGTPLFGGERKAHLRMTADKSGTELTEAKKNTLVAGDKVYAELTYKNTTGEPEEFVLAGASYSAGRMTDINYKIIKASGKSEDFKEYIEIDVTDIKDLSFKTFVWDSFETMNPDIDIETEYPILGEEYVRFLGRGEKKGDGYTFNWPNAGFEFEFEGEKAEVFVSSSNNDSSETNGNYFTVAVYDGDTLVRTNRMKLTKGWNTIYTEEEGDPKNKKIMLARSSEACRGTLAISKLRCENPPSPTLPREKHIEFIGDSYTAGYGNLDHELKIGYYCAKNTDNWNSYTGMVARHFGADNTVIAYQGKGVYANRSLSDLSGNMAEQFNYSEILVAGGENMSTKALHDFTSYQPDIVSVWLGTNDSAAPVDKATFKAAYEAHLDNIRSKYPDAKVLCVAIKGSLYHDTINAIADARGEENGYYMLSLNSFTTSALGHPDVPEDERIANQFIAKIDSIDGIWE